MERRKLFVMGLAVLISQRSIAQDWNRIPGGNIINATEWLGADVGSTVPLRIETRVTQPIEWYTNTIRRMTLSPTLLGQNVNVYTGLDLSGHLGIGNFTNLPGGPPPLTMIHLDNLGNQVAGYRPWMHTGVGMSDASEWMYVGMKREAADRRDAVINWSDNRELSGGGQFGPDALRMIFTSIPTTTSVSGSVNGLEIARLIPAVSGDEGFFGIGDYFTAGLQPTERLDVLDGNVRIRELPNEIEADTLTQFVVVDPNGVLGWRNLATVPPNSCDWNILNPGTSGAATVHHLFTAIGTSNTCPDANDHAGIGTNANTMPGKLTVVETANTSAVEHGVHVTMNGDADLTNGLFVTNRPASGVISETIQGADIRAKNGVGVQSTNPPPGTGTFGLRATAEFDLSYQYTDVWGVVGTASATGTVDELVGVRGNGTASGTARNVFGTNGVATSTSNGSVTNLYGAFGRVTGPGSIGYGVKGEAYYAEEGALWRFGVHGSVPNHGVADFTCGVFGKAPIVYNDTAFLGSWAGYFDGIVRVSGNTYVNGNVLVTSDESLKTNLEELTGSGDRIASLTPLSYEFIPQEHPHMQLPPGRQLGLGAQNVREVFPELVEEVPVPAVYDSTGAEIAPATSHLAVNYIGLIPVLIGAVQEQQAQVAAEQAANTALTDRLAEQEALMEEQSRRLDQLEAALASCCANPTNGDTRLLTTPPTEGSDDLNKALEGDARHLHIQPNPFTERTTLHYRLERAGRMQLLANSADGKSLKVLQDAALESGAYQFNWETADLTPGVYYVTLLLDGEPLVKKAVKVMR